MSSGSGTGTPDTTGGVLVSTAEVKSYLRLDGSGSAIDTQIGIMIDAAEAWVAERIGSAFTTETKTEYLNGGATRLRPHLQPIVSVTSVTDTWVLPADEEVEDATDYPIIDDGIYYAEDGATPSEWTDGRERWKVIYVGGYNNGDDTNPSGSVAAPAGIKLAVLGLIFRAWHAQGGLLQSGSQQTYKNFDGLDDGEVTRWLRPFDLRQMVY